MTKESEATREAENQDGEPDPIISPDEGGAEPKFDQQAWVRSILIIFSFSELSSVVRAIEETRRRHGEVQKDLRRTAAQMGGRKEEERTKKT